MNFASPFELGEPGLGQQQWSVNAIGTKDTLKHIRVEGEAARSSHGEFIIRDASR